MRQIVEILWWRYDVHARTTQKLAFQMAFRSARQLNGDTDRLSDLGMHDWTAVGYVSEHAAGLQRRQVIT